MHGDTGCLVFGRLFGLWLLLCPVALQVVEVIFGLGRFGDELGTILDDFWDDFGTIWATAAIFASTSGVHVRLSGHVKPVSSISSMIIWFVAWGVSQHSQLSPHAKIWWVLFLHQHAGLASPFGNAITS